MRKGNKQALAEWLHSKVEHQEEQPVRTDESIENEDTHRENHTEMVQPQNTEKHPIFIYRSAA